MAKMNNSTDRFKREPKRQRVSHGMSRKKVPTGQPGRTVKGAEKSAFRRYSVKPEKTRC